MTVTFGAVPFNNHVDRDSKVLQIKKEYKNMVQVRIDKKRKMIVYLQYGNYCDVTGQIVKGEFSNAG